MNTLIIAEAGVNHNGDMVLARELIDVAADAGADLVKFQTFNADRLVTPTAKKADYQTKAMKGIVETQHQMLKRLELTRSDHEALIQHCADKEIGFLSTGFDIQSINFLVDLGVTLFKVPSGEITNLPYLRHIGSYGQSVILSTGMATLAEVENALHILEKAGTALGNITVLHCSTQYPTPMQDVNLRAMLTMRDAFGVRVGYSDHTQGIEIPIAAAALGASVIEKHFTLDRQLPGPDHQASLEPAELKAMVSGIRHVELALGDGKKKPMGAEQENKYVIRKSLVAAKAIQAGDQFSENNLVAKRPGVGLSPMCWDEVIGKVAKRNFSENELIEL